MARWKVPLFARSLFGPNGRIEADSQGIFTAASEAEDAFFRALEAQVAGDETMALYINGDRMVDAAGNTVGQRQLYCMDKSTGYDDTNRLQEFIDQMSAEAVAARKPRIVALPQDQEYSIAGLLLRSHVLVEGNNTRLTKISDYSGLLPSDPTYGVVRTPWVQDANGSWFSGEYMGLRNIVLDPANRQYVAVLDLMNVRDVYLENVTAYASQWCAGWTFRLAGDRITVVDPRILGGNRVYQDAFHGMYGEDIHLRGGVVEGGDDGVAFGNDQVTLGGVYQNNKGLRNFSVIGTTVIATRGAGVKVYRSASSIHGLSEANKVSGGRIHVTGKAGLLRNGGVSFINHASPDNRVVTDVTDVKVHADLIVGTDGRSIHSAVSGVLVGSPSAITKANPAVVTLNNHGVPAGQVVTFMNIPSNGMAQLVGFYKTKNNATNTLQLCEDAYRGATSLDSTSYTTFNGADMISVGSGTGYKRGQVLTAAGGTGVERATFLVTQVGPLGQVEAVLPLTRGDYSVLPASPNNPTGGTGTGCQLFFETTHSGVNAFGSNSVGVSDCLIEGRILINDTTGAATRFYGGQAVDCQRVYHEFNLPVVPALGGILINNEASTQKSKDNRVARCAMTGNASMNTSYGFIQCSNSEGTLIEDVTIDEAPTNITGVRAIINGNILETKAISSISAADPAVFDFGATAHGRKVNEYVVITGNTLSAGDINNTVMVVNTVPSTTTLTLRTLDGELFRLNGATVSVAGSLSLANNTIDIRGLTMRKATGATGVVGVNTLSNAPPRATAVRVKDSNLRGVDTPITDQAASCPVFLAENVDGFTEPVKTYRVATVNHNCAVGDKFIVVVPGSAVTINAPTNPRKGGVLDITIKQSATAQTITWNAVFKKAADGAGVNNGTGTTRFVYDGTSWVQQGGALSYFA